MSSEQRSNSAVRNLRSIFENKTTESPDSRGRSPGSLGDLENQRPRSKIRASFIPVEPTMAALAAEQTAADSDVKRDSSVDLRRPSFSEGRSGDAVDAVRETVSAEQERREKDSSVAETIPETAVETPAIESSKTLGDSTTQKADKQAENPDKHVTGAEEEPAEMTAANPADEAAVSGGQALPPVAEDLRKSAKAATSKSKPASISTKGASKPSSSIKSPASQPKTPVSSASSQKAPVKKASRSSLTAPTAASVARAAAADKAAAVKQSSPVAKPKPREATKPAEVSSRLTAPTAATRARQESASAASTTAKPAPSASRPKPTASARPTPRTSLARPESRSSQTSSKKPAGPVDGSFLERMTRPTAASANRAQEKVEVHTPPPKKQLPLRPKTNGQPKRAQPTAATTDGSAPSASQADTQEEESILQEEHHQAPAPKGAEVIPAAEPEAAGSETPLQTNGHQEDVPTLESTPAALEKRRSSDEVQVMHL